MSINGLLIALSNFWRIWYSYSMEEDLIGIKNSAISLILEAKDLKELEELQLQFLGRSGKLTLALKSYYQNSSREKKRIWNVS